MANKPRIDLRKLAAEISNRYANLVLAHGELGVDERAFADRLSEIARKYLGMGARPSAILGFIVKLHTEDLGLALACARHTEAGWRRFEALYRKYLADLCRFSFDAHPASLDLADGLWVDLFFPDRSGRSRIASYEGRSSLATWLRVIVSNRIINERQRKSHGLQQLDIMREVADPAALQSVESEVRVRRYEPMIADCFQRACERLTPRERLILLLRFDEGLQLGQIAKLFSVHQSTITRQLDRLVLRLRAEVTSLLASDHGLSQAQIEECAFVAVESSSGDTSILTFIRKAQASGG